MGAGGGKYNDLSGYILAMIVVMIGWLVWEATGRHQLYRDGRFEPLLNSCRSLVWAFTSLGAFTYYVITEGGGRSLKCLCIIMEEGEGKGVGLMMI